MSRHPSPALPDRELAVAWQSTSLLLGYPDQELLSRLDLLDRSVRTLPATVGGPLGDVVRHLATTPLERLQADYVDTFDTRRRCTLFLTYFLHGDTRRRGVALLRFQHTYQRAGVALTAEELPDHLCVVLEYGATVDRAGAWRLLLDHRAGLELLRLSLRDAGSPWAPAAEALSATLPPLRGPERDAVRRLAAEGPPEEEVGLDGYTGPAFDPALDRTGAR